MTSISEEIERPTLVKFVRKFGDLNTDAVLDSFCSTFSIPEVEGVISYRIEAGSAVVFGDPLCTEEDRKKLVEAFQSYCREKDLKIVYVIVSPKFADSFLQEQEGVLIQFGHKLILDPRDNPAKRTGSRAVLVRKKVKRARTEGVSFAEYLNEDLHLEKEMEGVGKAWLGKREGAQIYIAHLNFFNDKEGKRWFYAKKEGKVIGFLILNEIQASKGWLLNNLIITQDAPPGTSELLVISTLEVLEKEECENVVIGPVVSSQIESIRGLNPFVSWIIRRVFTIAKSCFRLEGQTIFWDKFAPKTEPSYVLFEKVGIRTIRALMKAMNAQV